MEDEVGAGARRLVKAAGLFFLERFLQRRGTIFFALLLPGVGRMSTE